MRIEPILILQHIPYLAYFESMTASPFHTNNKSCSLHLLEASLAINMKSLVVLALAVAASALPAARPVIIAFCKLEEYDDCTVVPDIQKNVCRK
jgi:hypothetical protein